MVIGTARSVTKAVARWRWHQGCGQSHGVSGFGGNKTIGLWKKEGAPQRAGAEANQTLRAIAQSR